MGRDLDHVGARRDELRSQLLRALGNYNMKPSSSTAGVLRQVATELHELELTAAPAPDQLRARRRAQDQIPVPKCILEESSTEETKAGKTVYGTQSYDHGRIGP